VSPPAMTRVVVVNAARDWNVRRVAAGRTALMRDCENMVVVSGWDDVVRSYGRSFEL
jgi:hypothetical protein